MKQIILKNTSRYPDHEVRWLVNFAFRYVHSEMERMGELELFDRHGFYCQFGNKQFDCYSGRYFHELVNDKGGRAHDAAYKYRRFLVKIGRPEKFPMRSWDARYKEDGPEGELKSWQEAAVAITAHELSHVKFSGHKDGEFSCDAIMHDAVDAFRREQPDFQAYVLRSLNHAAEERLALAVKRSPEAILATRLARSRGKLALWTRKQRLATTKLRHYQREVNRLEKRSLDESKP